MRPFKFFFFVTIAFMLFFSLAKVLLIAAFFAAIMSITYFGVKSLTRFLGNMTWENDRYRGSYRHADYSSDYLQLEEHPILRGTPGGYPTREKENIIIIK